MAEASRSKYISAFILANIASNIVVKLVSLIIGETNAYKEMIEAQNFEAAIRLDNLTCSIFSMIAWVLVFLCFRGVYFKRTLWYYITSVALTILLVNSTPNPFHETLEPYVNEDFFIMQGWTAFLLSMSVPLYFIYLNEKRYYPPKAQTKSVAPKPAKTVPPRSPLAVTSNEILNSNLDDEEFYETALRELEEGRAVQSTYAKALTLSEGKVKKAKWKYVELRVTNLKSGSAPLANVKEVEKPKARMADGVDPLGAKAYMEKELARRAISSTNTDAITEILEKLGYKIETYNDVHFGGLLVDPQGNNIVEFYSHPDFRNRAKAELGKILKR